MSNLLFPIGETGIINKISEKLKNPSQVAVQLFGQNLESHGIKDGDYIVFDFNAPVKVCSFAIVWRDCDYKCYFVESIRGEKIRLINDVRKFTVSRSQVLGRVIRMERDL